MTTQQPLDRFETELLAQLRKVVAEAGTSTARRGPRWRRPAISVGVAAAATATILLATSGVGPGGGSTASAADVLQDAARHAESAPAADGTYWYVRSVDSIDEGEADDTVDLETWQRKDGTTWVSEDSAPAHELRGSSFALCGTEVDYATLRALPTEAVALRAALAESTSHALDAVAADEHDRFVTDCTISLLTLPVSNAVRGAAYRSLAALPSTENLGATTDGQGRTGTELVFRHGQYTQHILVDADSGELLRWDLAGTKGERQRTVLETGWTDTVPH